MHVARQKATVIISIYDTLYRYICKEPCNMYTIKIKKNNNNLAKKLNTQ